LNELHTKYVTFRETMKTYENMNYIEKIKAAMNAREFANHRVILKDSDINVERLCYLIFKKCFDFKIISHLDVSKNHLGDIGISYILHLVDMYSRHLTHLNISHNKIGRASIDLLSAILSKNVSNLSSLNISGNLLGDKLFCDFSVGLSKNTSLERLWSTDNSLGKASCLILGTVLRFDKKLKFLDIARNPLDDDLLHDLFKGLISNSTLEVLILNECNMTNLSFKILDVVMQLNSSLREIYLERNKLINLSCEKLADILNKNHSLEIVSLIGNKGIDHEGIDVILERQRKIPIKVIGMKELYNVKFSKSDLIFEFF